MKIAIDPIKEEELSVLKNLFGSKESDEEQPITYLIGSEEDGE